MPFVKFTSELWSTDLFYPRWPMTMWVTLSSITKTPQRML